MKILASESIGAPYREMVVGTIDPHRLFRNHHADPIFSDTPRAILAVIFRDYFIAHSLSRTLVTDAQTGIIGLCMVQTTPAYLSCVVAARYTARRSYPLPRKADVRAFGVAGKIACNARYLATI